ncbi:MAG: hypothetical protein AYP45_04090 [Candidatus Brocadia carolinensis]|uniref:Uncharacterized protein n=1 Tax=Candidatus Brocadia carolinensis TaxID=1004156 RepID=A0A1V4AW52_9BACT|nr:MAG: hypothetical protein AYP45_04090 [Candidatus Brocadia caroliniensis]
MIGGNAWIRTICSHSKIREYLEQRINYAKPNPNTSEKNIFLFLTQRNTWRSKAAPNSPLRKREIASEKTLAMT